MTDRHRDIEHRIEEAFMRHQDDVRPESGDWEGVRSGVARARRARVALGSVAALAAIAAAVFVVPRLVGDDTSNVIGPGPSASESPAPSGSPEPAGLPANWSYLRNDAMGYWLALPTDWVTGSFEGHVEFRPPGQPGSAIGEDTFFVDTFLRTPGDGMGAPDGSGSDVTIGSRTAKRWESAGANGSRAVTYELTLPCYIWPGSTAMLDCDPSQRILRVAVVASTGALWDTYGATGERVVRAIRAGDDPFDADSYRTLHGTSTVAWDVKTWAVAMFLEARIMGDVDRAKTYLSDSAAKQYDDHDGGLDLYDPDSSRHMVTYEIAERVGADANSDELTVRVTEENSDATGRRSTYTETFGVGPGTSDAERHRGSTPVVIRFARRDNG